MRGTILCAIAMADVGGGWHGALELAAPVWQRLGALHADFQFGMWIDLAGTPAHRSSSPVRKRR